MYKIFQTGLGKYIMWAAQAVACLLLIFSTGAAANAAAIAQDFQTSETNLATGALVSLKPGPPNTIELANQENASKLVGVVGDRPLISLTESNSKSVSVVTNGVSTALVSNINGEINVGDPITASAIAGVGMKADSSSVVIGTAQAALSAVSTKERSIADNRGDSHIVRIGSLPVQVNIIYFASAGDSQSFMPAFLQNFSNAIAGKEVSAVRVLICTIILILSFISIAVLLYASVRSSIISIGRNPLSEVSVRKSLLQIGGIIVGILLLSCIAVYLILVT